MVRLPIAASPPATPTRYDDAALFERYSKSAIRVIATRSYSATSRWHGT